MRFRRALDREKITEGPSAASELPFVGPAGARADLLLADEDPEKDARADLLSARWRLDDLEILRACPVSLPA
jgi:hypothetical protein